MQRKTHDLSALLPSAAVRSSGLAISTGFFRLCALPGKAQADSVDNSVCTVVRIQWPSGIGALCAYIDIPDDRGPDRRLH